MRRLRCLAAASLALLCVFTIAAGVTVARVLPASLARWDVPRVAPAPLTSPQTVLGPASGAAASSAAAGPAARAAGPPATPAGVAAALAPVLRSAGLGSHVGVEVRDLATGQLLYASNADSPFEPASTAKLATAVTALAVLGPGARFSTRVVRGPAPGDIVLVGGGDPTLAAGPPPASDYPQPATLAELAAAAARTMRADGTGRVQLSYDASLYTGPALAPGWPASYVTTGNVTPISPLEVDQGRLTPSGAPEDADDPLNSRPRTFTPAAEAANAFAGFLRADGIDVAAGPAAAAAPGAAVIASVASPPLAEVVQWMLTESNNVIAENLARQLAIATGYPASFSGAAAAERAELGKLGVSGGVQLVDGSGLSPDDRVTPAALVQLLRLAASAAHPGLRAVITGLPVDGFSGTLAPGGSAFAEAGPAALGVVRAKTGNLATVGALAGIAAARNGQLLLFAVLADRLAASNGLALAGLQMARLATVLAGCGCR